MQKTCSYCGLEYPKDSKECLACGRPAPTTKGFPNVLLARKRKEKEELKKRYEQAVKKAEKIKTIKRVSEFRSAIETDARLVTACAFKKLTTLDSDNSVFPTYQQLYHSKLAFAGDDLNNNRRLYAEEATLPGCSERIHYAVLALDDVGLRHYGDYFLVWKIDMVSHRTSLFIANCVTWRLEKKIALNKPAPPGNRSTWEDRHLLSVVKHATDVKANTQRSHFAGILVRDRNSKNKYDVFIEGHIWGPLTRMSLAKLTCISPEDTDARRIYAEHIADGLRTIGVDVVGI